MTANNPQGQFHELPQKPITDIYGAVTIIGLIHSLYLVLMFLI